MGIFSNFLGNRKGNPGGEMNFLDHVEDLRWHIIRSAFAIIICAIIVFIRVEWIFDRVILGPAHNDFISYKWFCEFGKLLHVESLCMQKVNMQFMNTSVTGQFMMSLSISMLLGFVVAFPYILWELWKFIKPAMKPSEIKMARGIVFWCSVLFFIGVSFAYFIVAPYAINFFGNYQLSPSVQNIITLDNYFEMISTLILALGVVFELPILVLFLTKIGVLTPRLLKKNRRYAFLVLYLLSILIAPPDVFSSLLIFAPLYLLFEITILLSNRTYRQRQRKLALKKDDD